MIHTGEALQVLAFVFVVAGVYVATGVLLYRRFIRKPAMTPGKGSWALFAVAALGFLCMLYGWLVEPRWIEVTETRVPTKRLPAGHRGVRIVHLTDIHSDPSPLVEERLPGIVAGLKPDLIVFTGDAANSPGGVPVFQKCLTDLGKLAPTFVVKGNWDALAFPHLDRFFGTGALELEETVATVDVNGAKVRVVGASYGVEAGSLGRVLEALPADGPAVLLHHYPHPDIVPGKLAPRVDLMCAGHVHGGQVALPFYGALITLSKFGKRFERGFYPDADGFGFPLYVSRGTGMEGGIPFRVRFCSRPEVALLELVPAP